MFKIIMGENKMTEAEKKEYAYYLGKLACGGTLTKEEDKRCKELAKKF